MQMKEIDEINSIGPDGENSDVRVKEVAKFTDGQEVRIAGQKCTGYKIAQGKKCTRYKMSA